MRCKQVRVFRKVVLLPHRVFLVLATQQPQKFIYQLTTEVGVVVENGVMFTEIPTDADDIHQRAREEV